MISLSSVPRHQLVDAADRMTFGDPGERLAQVDLRLSTPERKCIGGPE
jgi:hypothetical protein